jgi:DNA-binding NarL/FixJ family response regulator
VRAALQTLLEAKPNFEVVGEVRGGQVAVNKVCETQPDVTIIDMRMPETSGIETIEYLLQECPSTHILVFTEYDNPAYALSALAASALGYISKSAATADLLTAIRSVYRGRYFVDPMLASPLLQDFLRKRAIACGQP